MSEAEQELESGFYWARWEFEYDWEPAEYDENTNEWFGMGLGGTAVKPMEIGPRIPQYTDTL